MRTTIITINNESKQRVFVFVAIYCFVHAWLTSVRIYLESMKSLLNFFIMIIIIITTPIISRRHSFRQPARTHALRNGCTTIFYLVSPSGMGWERENRETKKLRASHSTAVKIGKRSNHTGQLPLHGV